MTFTSVNGKSGYHVLKCGDQPNIVVAEDEYKIKMDAEQTIPEAGQDIKLHGECTAILKGLPDRTYMLEPLDKTRNMQVTVEKGIYANKDGRSGKLIEPYSYTFPFLFSIGKMDKSNSSGNGTVYLNYTSPQKGKVVWRIVSGDKTVIETVDIDQGAVTYSPGTTTRIGSPGNDAKNAIAISAVTNLNVLNYFMAKDNGQVAMQNAQKNISNAKNQMAFAKQSEAHMHDPNYFKTKQGQADLQKAMSLQQQIGGNIANISNQTKQMSADISNKVMNDSGYAGSKQFNQDLGKEQMSELGDEEATGNAAMAQVVPGAAIIRNEGNFFLDSVQSFNESKEASIGGVQTSIKIKVEKITN